MTSSLCRVPSLAGCMLVWLSAAVVPAVPAPAQSSLVDHTPTILVPGLAPSYYPGAAWGDVDGDGYDDLFVTNYYGANHLFLNRPALLSPSPTARQLVDLTPPVLMDPAGHGEGAVLADFDGDGDLDLYVVNAGGTPNHLYANLGGGAWADVSAGSGVAYFGVGEGCAVADWDRDGDLDLYLLNYGATAAGETDRWFRNDGGLSFTDVTPATAVFGPAPGGACAFADFDGDGDQDLFVGNDGAANRLCENRGAAGFVDVTAVVGGAALADAPGGCFGVRWIDYDRDGDLDLYVSNSSTFHGTSSLNRMFRNDPGPLGGRAFTLVVSGAEDPGSGMAVTGGDLDRDGDEDLAIANFGTNEIYLGGPVGALLPPFAPAPAVFFTDPLGDTSSSITRCDFDHDGDLDVFAGGTTLRAYENVTAATISPAVRTVTARFVGDRAAPIAVPRDGHGTAARLYLRPSPVVVSPTGGLPQALQQVDGGSGYAQDANECFWALPTPHGAYAIDHLAITWADGVREDLNGVPTPTAPTFAERVTIHYPKGISAYGALAVTTVPLSRSSTNAEFPPARVGAANFALAASRLPDPSIAMLVVGFAPTSVPTPFGVLLVDPALLLVAAAVDGVARWPLPLPTDPAIAGETIYSQCFAFDSAGVVRSSFGVAAVVQP